MKKLSRLLLLVPVFAFLLSSCATNREEMETTDGPMATPPAITNTPTSTSTTVTRQSAGGY